MAIKKTVKKLSFFDFNSWNFIIFLLLGFILIVVVAVSLQGGATNLGVQAGFACPNVRLRDPRECPQGWKVDFNSGRCPKLTCPVEPIPMEPSRMVPQPTGSIKFRLPPNEPVVPGPSY